MALATKSGIRLFQSTPPVKAATPPVPDFGGFPDISIHAAREGGDPDGQEIADFFGISIHAAREGGDVILSFDSVKTDISIHAAREGGDTETRYIMTVIMKFQSTPPVKAATAETYKCNQHSRKQQV